MINQLENFNENYPYLKHYVLAMIIYNRWFYQTPINIYIHVILWMELFYNGKQINLMNMQ